VLAQLFEIRFIRSFIGNHQIVLGEFAKAV